MESPRQRGCFICRGEVASPWLFGWGNPAPYGILQKKVGDESAGCFILWYNINMVTKKKSTKKAPTAVEEELSVVTPRPYEPSAKSYFRIAIIFGAATVVLIGAVFYFVFYGARV